VIGFPFFLHLGGQWLWRSQDFGYFGHDFCSQTLIGLPGWVNRITPPKGNDPVQPLIGSLIAGDNPQGQKPVALLLLVLIAGKIRFLERKYIFFFLEPAYSH
jgi:hypothetical protein